MTGHLLDVSAVSNEHLVWPHDKRDRFQAASWKLFGLGRSCTNLTLSRATKYAVANIPLCNADRNQANDVLGPQEVEAISR